MGNGEEEGGGGTTKEKKKLFRKPSNQQLWTHYSRSSFETSPLRPLRIFDFWCERGRDKEDVPSKVGGGNVVANVVAELFQKAPLNIYTATLRVF